MDKRESRSKGDILKFERAEGGRRSFKQFIQWRAGHEIVVEDEEVFKIWE